MSFSRIRKSLQDEFTSSSKSSTLTKIKDNELQRPIRQQFQTFDDTAYRQYKQAGTRLQALEAMYQDLKTGKRKRFMQPNRSNSPAILLDPIYNSSPIPATRLPILAHLPDSQRVKYDTFEQLRSISYSPDSMQTTWSAVIKENPNRMSLNAKKIRKKPAVSMYTVKPQEVPSSEPIVQAHLIQIRDCERQEKIHTPTGFKRGVVVKGRMNSYWQNRVIRDFKPKQSENKRIEISLLKEKIVTKPRSIIPRLNIEDIVNKSINYVAWYIYYWLILACLSPVGLGASGSSRLAPRTSSSSEGISISTKLLVRSTSC